MYTKFSNSKTNEYDPAGWLFLAGSDCFWEGAENLTGMLYFCDIYQNFPQKSSCIIDFVVKFTKCSQNVIVIISSQLNKTWKICGIIRLQNKLCVALKKDTEENFYGRICDQRWRFD